MEIEVPESKAESFGIATGPRPENLGIGRTFNTYVGAVTISSARDLAEAGISIADTAITAKFGRDGAREYRDAMTEMGTANKIIVFEA